MRVFDMLPPDDALQRLLSAIDASRNAGRGPPTETIATVDARDRALAVDVAATTALPEFRRSAVDGYAIKAASAPGVLRVTGEVRMGAMSSLIVRAGEAVLVHTGGHVPDGADAVVMVEQVKTLAGDSRPAPDIDAPRLALPGAVTRSNKIQIAAKLSPGDNLILAGEDISAGEIVMRAGALMREQEIGGLLSLGITSIAVARRPRVALIASGDELVTPDQPTRPGQVRNINGPMLAALVRRNGGEPVDFGILPDVRVAFESAAKRAMDECDMVIFMASSSVGERDFVPDIVGAMGAPGVLAHGIKFRPGKPTLFALADGKPVLGLPGNPISALVTGMRFAMPALWRIQGVTRPPAPGIARATLTQAVGSPRDLEHWFPVRLSGSRAEPVSTKSNLIFGLVRAAGLVCAPIGVAGFAAGDAVDVTLM